MTVHTDLDLIREALDMLYSAAFVDPHEQHRLDAARDDAVAALPRLERLLQEQEEARGKARRKLAREQARKRNYRDAVNAIKQELLPSAAEVMGILKPGWNGSDDEGARARALAIANAALSAQPGSGKTE